MEARLSALSSLPLPDMDLEAVLPPFQLPPQMDLATFIKMSPEVNELSKIPSDDNDPNEPTGYPGKVCDHASRSKSLIHIRLGNFMLLDNDTTFWCTEREEHGCQLLPLFTCSTKLHVPTAHSWTQNVVLETFAQPVRKYIGLLKYVQFCLNF
jgi:hypothetical protein